MNFSDAEEYFGYSSYEIDAFSAAEPQEEDAVLAPLISVVSASGGVGKSSLALACARLAAAAGIDTVLVEGDLQFGDYGFWLGLDDTLPTLGDPKPYTPIELCENLILYKAPLFPEVAEEVSEALESGLSGIRANRGLVIADTGGFWSGLTAGLLMESDLFALVVDDRPSSVAGAIKAGELIARLGVPSARTVAVYNRWGSKARLGANEVRQALDVQEAHCIPVYRGNLEDLFCLEELATLPSNNSPYIRAVRQLLTAILPRVGHLYADAPLHKRLGMR